LAALNPIVERLKEQRKHLGSMLTTWPHGRKLHPAEQSQQPDLLSKSRFRLTVQRNPVLDPQKSDIVHREKYVSLMKSVTQKYQAVKEMVPLALNSRFEEGSWGVLERIFPGRASAGKPEEPLQPGEMRSGTVIQKFNMFPKPGQSLDDFKRRVEPVREQPRHKDVTHKKTLVESGQRLFSKITEIPSNSPPLDLSAGQPEEAAEFFEPNLHQNEDHALPELDPMEMPAPLLPTELRSETLIPINSESDVSKPDFQELPSSLEKKDVPSKLPLAVPSKSVESGISQKNIKPEAEDAGVSEKAKPIIPPIRNQQPEALPVKKVIPPKAEIPKAIPTKREVPKALPSALNQERKPLPIRQNILASKVVQRAPEHSDNPKPIPAEMPTHFKPSMTYEQPADIIPQAESESMEMPIRLVVDQRRQFARGIFNSPMPIHTQAPAQTPLIRNPQRPLFSPQKYRYEAEVKNYDQPIPANEQILSSGTSLPLDLAETFLPRVHSERILDSVYQTTEKTPKPQPAILRTDPPVLQPFKPAAIAGKETPVRSTSGIAVQREIEQPDENPEMQVAPKTDYKKLAEDVYPFVKRLLEIENERSRGNLR